MKRILLLMVVFLSFQCSAALIITPAIVEGVAGDFPETLTVDIYNQGQEAVVLEVEVFQLNQKPSGVIAQGPSGNTRLTPERTTVVVEGAGKGEISFARDNAEDSLYEVAIIKQTSLTQSTIAQAIAVPFILKKGSSEVFASLDSVNYDRETGIWEVIVNNKGPEHFKAGITLAVQGESGPNTGSVQGIVLPGVARVFTLELPLDSSKGEGQLEVELGNSSQTYCIRIDSNGAVECIEQK